MFRKDLLVRQFEEFGKFLAVVFGLKKDNKWPELEGLINTSAFKYTNIEIKEAEKLENVDLIETLTQKHSLKEPNLKMLADLLYEKGIGYSKQFKEEEANNDFEKAFIIYEFIQANSLEIDFSLDMHFKLTALKQLLRR
ncbi:MAG TPA: hypothetical protein VN026_08095 [Bacteroidia bacterium]|jgi:hypothetical protein|nr:hypothetical protein [Bacteroidia bacterium]